MKLILYKIVMPFTVADYEKAFLYTFAHMSKQETGKGSGVEVKENRLDDSYLLPDGTKPQKCHFTHKVYHCERFVSSWVKKIAYRMYGKNSLKFLEDSWNCFPYMCTTSWNMEKPNKIDMTVESMHIDNDHARNDQPKYISTSRLLKNKNSLKGVTIKTLDVTEPVRGLKQLDTTKFRSERAQIGPLEPSDKKEAWHDKFDGPIMCVYKLAKIRYDVTFGSTLESKFMKQQEFLLYRMHKTMILLMDSWWHLSFAEVKAFEASVHAELGENLNREDIELVEGYYGHDDHSDASDDQKNSLPSVVQIPKNSGSRIRTSIVETPPASRKNSDASTNLANRPRGNSLSLEIPRIDETDAESKLSEVTTTYGHPNIYSKLNKVKQPPKSQFRKSSPEPGSMLSVENPNMRTPLENTSLGASSFNDLDSFVTPNESMPPRCDQCNARHKYSEPHFLKV